MIEKILNRLESVRKLGNYYMAKCPHHHDEKPSLKLTELPDSRILLHCFAGCPTHDILHSIGLEMGDLFPNNGLGHYQGFQQIENTVKDKQKDKHLRDEIILEIAKNDRAAGKRLDEKDMELERQAFMRIRARNQNAIT